jgi:lycopene cyclase domain-containing protein
MRHLTYLLTILVFCGIPWLIMLKYRERVLKKYEIVILVVVIIGILFSATDYFALRWGAWYYDPSKTLNVHFLTEIETYLLGAGTSLEVASATLIWASFVDRKSKKKVINKKSMQKLRNKNKLHNTPIRNY